MFSPFDDIDDEWFPRPKHAEDFHELPYENQQKLVGEDFGVGSPSAETPQQEGDKKKKKDQ